MDACAHTLTHTHRDRDTFDTTTNSFDKSNIMVRKHKIYWLF